MSNRRKLKGRADRSVARLAPRQLAMTAAARAIGGPESCAICGDTDDLGFYHWTRENPDVIGQLCADCSKIQQSMYGDPRGDTLVQIGADS